MRETLTNDELIAILMTFPTGTPVRVRDTEVPLVSHAINADHVCLTKFVGLPRDPVIPTIIIG
jgi:hypothetical protein